MLDEVNHGDPAPTSPRAISQAVQNSQLRKEIDSLRQSLAERDRECERLRARVSNSLANNLCPDHRDKQSGKPCLACEIERLRAEVERLKNVVEDFEECLEYPYDDQ